MSHSCLLCGAPRQTFLDFGPMPIANTFALPDDPVDTFRSRLSVARCSACHMVQLTDPVPRERMFHADYPFYSASSRTMVAHFQELGAWLTSKFDRRDLFVVELGSNDGSLLEYFAHRRIRHLGIEPAQKVAAAAVARGVRTRTTFFDELEAVKIRDEDGPADVIVACNVFCHLSDLDSVMQGILTLLAPDGIFVFEDPYLPQILDRVAFDQFYDEHVWYFTVTAIEALARRYGLVLCDAIPQSTHGGSMRYVLARTGTQCEGLAGLLTREATLGLDTPAPYKAFAEHVERNRHDLVELLKKLRNDGCRVMGYGATAKSSTVVNYCGITKDHLEAISDTTPAKQGRLTPGARIPVVRREEFVSSPPDYALLFAWNHAVEIFQNEGAFTAGGGRWITYVPRVEVRGAPAEAPSRLDPAQRRSAMDTSAG